MPSLWIARHGNRQDFVDNTWRAQAERPHDPGLSEDGVEQVKQLAAHVETLEVDRVVASPFLRAVQTAHHVAERSGHAVHLEPGLGEWANADWFDARPEPLSAEVLQEQFARVTESHDPCVTPAYPETKDDAFSRIGAAARCLVETYPGESLFLVGHGITVQGVLLGLVGDVRDRSVPLASLTQLVQHERGWQLVRRNAVEHLDGGPEGGERMV